MSIPCFIFARKNSQRLKNKNRIKFLNLPLIVHTINYARNSKFVKDVVVSTDDYKIKTIAEKLNCITIYPRPKKLSNNTTSSLSALKHAMNFYQNNVSNFDVYAYLQITEPLRPPKILDKCINILLKNKRINSSFAAFETKKTYWIKLNNQNYKSFNPEYNSADKKKIIYREDCGLALASRKKITLTNNKLVNKPFRIVPYSSFEGLLDIHNEKDLLLGEFLKKSLLNY